jgi:hypothetical protein
MMMMKRKKKYKVIFIVEKILKTQTTIAELAKIYQSMKNGRQLRMITPEK